VSDRLQVEDGARSVAAGKPLRLALITAARNEAAFIGETIRCVLKQTVLPAHWVIVSDGSTDGTDAIVQKYAKQYSWLECVILPARKERNFAGKVFAFKAGLERLSNSDYDVIGNLDADVSLEDSEYFAFLLEKFVLDPGLGVAGCPFREGSVQYNYRFSRPEHVSGACQLFRRQCFEEIGGYIPLQIGAVDLMANVTARMKGWKTTTFPEKFCVHHREMGSANDHFVGATFKSGYGDYLVGVHPAWQIARSVYQMSRRPYLLGGTLLLTGYFWAMLKRAPRPISKELIQFRHKEQKQWLVDYFWKALRLARVTG
jgi:glycosyltransferase involved in cell wall biosynthesis